jgi:hypothetical protein
VDPFDVDPFSSENVAESGFNSADKQANAAANNMNDAFATMDPFLDSVTDVVDTVAVDFDGPDEVVKPTRRSAGSKNSGNRRGSGDHIRGGKGSTSKTASARSSSRDKPRPRRANSCDQLPGLSSGSSAPKQKQPPMRTRSGDKLGSKLNYFENLSGQNDQPFSFGFWRADSFEENKLQEHDE